MSELTSLSDKIALALRGLSELKTASLLMIISSIIAAAGLIGSLSMLLSLTAISPVEVHYTGVPVVVIGSVLAAFGLVVAALILQLVAVFAYLVPSFRKLRDYDPQSFNTASLLVYLGYVIGTIIEIVGVVIFIASIVAMSLVGILSAIAVIIIGAILLLLGYVGLIIGCFKLKDQFNESLFLVAGILFIISLALSFIPYTSAAGAIIDFIAWIITYVAASTTIQKIKTQQKVA